MSYHLPPGFVPTVKSHGNSKKGTPYHPTWASTKQQIKEKCGSGGPKCVVASLSAAAGGVLEATAPRQLPWGEKQIVNFKAKCSFDSRLSSFPGTSRDAAADDLFLIMQKAFTEDPSRKFVRAVNAAPEPAVVVTTDRQLQDLARFCTAAFEFSPLTVDPTFCLGEFDVTLITYRHLFLQSKRYKSPPVFVGPGCIHYKKSFATYLFFASSVIGQCRQLEGVRALGTDGELTLIDAFKHEFGFAQHMTCFIHVRRNVKDKLRECNIPTQLSTNILDDIFGKKLGSVYIEGLVDAQDSSDFQEKVARLIEKWQDIALPSSGNMERFITWFQNCKAPVIRDSMLRSVREECGLGSPPSQFTTNACETANSMLKNQVNYKRSDMINFLRKLNELISEQEREIERAIIGRGKYELRPQYQSFHVPETKWFAMSTLQREQHLKKFADASVSDVSSPGDLTLTTSVSKQCLGRDLTLASSLSVDVHTVAAAGQIPLNCLEGIWSKAAELLKTEGAIVSAPGVGSDAKYVLSYSGQRPHLVVPKRGGTFACDQDCPNWKALNICAHSVAVAELCGKLSEVVAWFKKAKKAPNLTQFAEATMPKGRGRKGSLCPRKRKASVPTATVLENPSLAQHVHDTTFNQHVSTPVSVNFNPPPIPLSSPGDPEASAAHITVQHPSVTNLQMTSFSSPLQPQLPWSYGYHGYLPPPPYPTYGATPLTPPSQQASMPPRPFTLTKIVGNISVCAGCRNRYPKQPTPPDDLCIRHQEWREYVPAGSQTPQSRFGNTYYHFTPYCVWLRCPGFVPTLLEVPPELCSQLDPTHKDRLRKDFLIHLP